MDKYDFMTELYADQANIRGETYGKQWRRFATLKFVRGTEVTGTP